MEKRTRVLYSVAAGENTSAVVIVIDGKKYIEKIGQYGHDAAVAACLERFVEDISKKAPAEELIRTYEEYQSLLNDEVTHYNPSAIFTEDAVALREKIGSYKVLLKWEP